MPNSNFLIKNLLVCLSFIFLITMGTALAPDVRDVVEAGGSWALVSLLGMWLIAGACWVEVMGAYESPLPWMALSTAHVSLVLILSKSGVASVWPVMLLLTGIAACAIAVGDVQEKLKNIRNQDKK